MGAYSVTAFDAKSARGSGRGNPGRDLLRELPHWEVPRVREPRTGTSRQGAVCLSYHSVPLLVIAASFWPAGAMATELA